MKSLKTYQDFLEKVKTDNPDEFNELPDILLRHETLELTNNNLKTELKASQLRMESLITDIEQFQKSMTDRILNTSNRVAQAKDALERAEEEKEQLMVGNEEKTEKILGETNEHGQILMTINSLYLVIMQYSDANPKHFFKPSSIAELPSHFNDIKKNEKAGVTYWICQRKKLLRI